MQHTSTTTLSVTQPSAAVLDTVRVQQIPMSNDNQKIITD